MTSPHAPLITALTTFYTLLADLHHYPPSAITLPPLPTGRYSGDRIDTDAARDNGFGPEAIDLLSQLPFLTDSDCQIAYDTQALNYLDDDAADAFDFARDPAYQERTDLMAEYVVVLTRGLMYGTELIYDTRNCRLAYFPMF